MNTLNRYVTRGFLGTFFMAIGILTFGMTGARLIRVLEFISQGIPLINFFYFTLYMLPIILTFTIPWAVMVAVMLVFGRLSADSEITAMRACGVSILQIISPILLVTFLLTIFCLYLQLEVGPPALGKSRNLMTAAVLRQPTAMFEPGKPVKYNNMLVYIDDKDKNQKLSNVQIFVLDDKGDAAQDITAERGELLVDREKQILHVVLYDCIIVDKKSKPEARARNSRLAFPFNYGVHINEMEIGKRPKHMNTAELLGRIRIEKKFNRDTTKLEVELNQRIAFAISPIAFLLLGLPLAIRTSRRETSVGLFISVILAGVFFLSIIVCDSLVKVPQLKPQYLLWLPNIIFQTIGAVMTWRISQR